MDDNFIIDVEIINCLYEWVTLDNIAEFIPDDFLRYMWATVKPTFPVDRNKKADIGKLTVCYLAEFLALLRYCNIVLDPQLYNDLLKKSWYVLFCIAGLEEAA